jgi:hypothetical protein
VGIPTTAVDLRSLGVPAKLALVEPVKSMIGGERLPFWG